jgi:hypothetical protein
MGSRADDGVGQFEAASQGDGLTFDLFIEHQNANCCE